MMQLPQDPEPPIAAGDIPDPMRSDEGRACEPSRRLTRRLLFTRRGWPGAWLVVLFACWIGVAIGGWTQREETLAAQRRHCLQVQQANASRPPAERQGCASRLAVQRSHFAAVS